MVGGLLALGLALSRPGFAAVACKVTSSGDLSANADITPGSFRDMLLKANIGQCSGQKIVFHVSKVTLNAPLGNGILAGLKGLVIEPAPGIAEVEIVAKYTNPNFVAGCSSPSAFKTCFAYLPISDVTLRHIRMVADSSSVSMPLFGICIDSDLNGTGVTHNNILIEKSRFEGFSEGGVRVSSLAYGVAIRQTTFSGSGPGIVLDPDTQGPNAPVMGGSAEALHAVVDVNGAIQEYHLRGVSNNAGIVAVELFEAEKGAGAKYLKDCDLHVGKPIDGKWDIDCVLPADITLPFNYAVTLTSGNGTSMFSTGTIPVDVAKLSTTKPLPPQAPVIPPTTPPDKNPPIFKEPAAASGDVSKPLNLNITPFEGAGGCSLIR